MHTEYIGKTSPTRITDQEGPFEVSQQTTESVQQSNSSISQHHRLFTHIKSVCNEEWSPYGQDSAGTREVLMKQMILKE